MSHLFVTCGVPGSGKSTWVEEFERSRVGCPPLVVLCPDAYRLEITGRAFYAPAEEAVWSAVKITARVLLRRGYNVLIDATSTSKSSRTQWIRMARDIGCPCSCYYINTPFDICRHRNEQRSNRVPDEILDRMIRDFEEPTLEEGFSQISKTWEAT